MSWPGVQDAVLRLYTTLLLKYGPASPFPDAGLSGSGAVAAEKQISSYLHCCFNTLHHPETAFPLHGPMWGHVPPTSGLQKGNSVLPMLVGTCNVMRANRAASAVQPHFTSFWCLAAKLPRPPFMNAWPIPQRQPGLGAHTIC